MCILLKSTRTPRIPNRKNKKPKRITIKHFNNIISGVYCKADYIHISRFFLFILLAARGRSKDREGVSVKVILERTR